MSKICQKCNSEFPVWVTVKGKKINCNNRKYCSRECFHSKKKTWLEGKNHHSWKGGINLSLGYLRKNTKKMVTNN
jgi:hypothetical protein